MKVQSVMRLIFTLGILLVAVVLGHLLWTDYMYSPWTRDGRIRADIIRIAPDVSGLVTQVRVVDNQRVRKGDVLFVIDPVRFKDALAQSEAEVAQARQQIALAKAQMAESASTRDMRRQQAHRRADLGNDVISAESRADFNAQAIQAEAAYEAARATLHSAEAGLQVALASNEVVRRDLERSEVRAPTDGIISNLNLHPGDYTAAGTAGMALIDVHSFWVYAYFEETKLPNVRDGDRAEVRLMAGGITLKGHVESLAGGIVDRDNPTGDNLLADVNPVFTWVRLAQRIPVRIALDDVQDDVYLAAGMTASVTVFPGEQDDAKRNDETLNRQ
ncbi:efflux RND transporter periplasmic adaptor subunit [Pseudomonas aeruginosa]|uniref:efflux RND transporter periplasmic adaptor subunit n=1 Tax=Pseudomonas aeruginosa TaxID=287 RepID=UPI0034D2450F